MKRDPETPPRKEQVESTRDQGATQLNASEEIDHVHGEEPSQIFVAISRWILSHSKLTLCFTLAITGLAIWLSAHKLKVNNSLEMFTPPEADVLKTRDQYRALFGRDEFFLISARGDVFSADYLTRLKALEAEVSRLDIPLESVSTQSERKPAGSSGAGAVSVGAGAFDTEDFDTEDFDTEASGAERAEMKSLADRGDQTQLSEGSIVEETTSLVSARRTAYLSGGLQVKPWFDPIPSDSDVKALKSEALADPLLARRIVNDQGTLSVMMVRVILMSDDDMLKVFRALREIIQTHQTPDFKLRITGPPAINSALNETVVHDLGSLLAFSGLAMIIALIFLFRAPLMVAGPIIVVMISVIWTMGFMALCGMTLNLLSSILPAFLLCVGLGDSIHLQSIFNTCRREGLDYQAAIHRAIGLTGPPVLFTSLTTMIGLLSFQFASVTAIQDMGLAGGVGVIFALLHSLITLPLFLNWQGEGGQTSVQVKSLKYDQSEGEQVSSQQHDRIDRALEALVGASTRSRGRALVLIFTLVLALISGWGVTQLEVWHDDLETIPKDHPIRAAVLEVDQELGGVANIQILIRAEQLKNGVKDIDLLHAIESLSRDVLEYQTPEGLAIVGHALSITNVVKETRKALTRREDRYAIPPQDQPTSQQEVSQLLSLFEFQSPAQLRTISTIDLKNSHITLQVKWQEATSYTHLISYIERGVQEHLGPLLARGVVINPTGGVYLAFTIVSSLLSDLVKSFGAAFIVITLLMVLMLRGLKLGMLAMIPNLFPIMLMLGALGLAGIPLDLNNLLIASIALGIAVDDTIHLLHHFQASYIIHHDRERAISDALTHAGRAMLSTTILLSVGFSVYLFASIEAVQRFGVIIALTVFVALIVDLIVCPAILRLAYPDRDLL